VLRLLQEIVESMVWRVSEVLANHGS
jgi:hypothetical protein